MLSYLISNGGLTSGSTLFWDEPELNLNAKLQVKLVDSLVALAKAGIQIILTTHDLFLILPSSPSAPSQPTTPEPEPVIDNETTIKDVTLPAGTKIEGGQIEGKISGNPETLTAKTELSNVILDQSVDLPNDVTLKDVQLRDMSALGKFDLSPNGILEFQINGQKFKGRLDYKVEQRLFGLPE
jgi:hypothetical protein